MLATARHAEGMAPVSPASSDLSVHGGLAAKEINSATGNAE